MSKFKTFGFYNRPLKRNWRDTFNTMISPKSVFSIFIMLLLLDMSVWLNTAHTTNAANIIYEIVPGPILYILYHCKAINHYLILRLWRYHCRSGPPCRHY